MCFSFFVVGGVAVPRFQCWLLRGVDCFRLSRRKQQALRDLKSYMQRFSLSALAHYVYFCQRSVEQYSSEWSENLHTFAIVWFV